MHPGPALAEELYGDHIALQYWVTHGPSLAGMLGSHRPHQAWIRAVWKMGQILGMWGAGVEDVGSSFGVWRGRLKKLLVLYVVALSLC